MEKNKIKTEKREFRKKRIRAKISGSAVRPRVSVFRSNKHLVLQLVDDVSGKSLLQMTDAAAKGAKKQKLDKKSSSRELGKKFAEAAGKKGIKKVVFDRGGYLFHGRVKEAAEGLREGGLDF
ncbi:MAG: 50S ribosomal protein L18 [Candidatus Pacebacteria bacterium]|nr:50S ribosomal protein L18 [Candidatus Paceibacterota bacterium]